MTNAHITLPRHPCPCSEKISPFVDQVHQHTIEWVKQFQLGSDTHIFEHLQLSRFGQLAALTYPDATLDRLKIISDWNTWFFVINDQCDKSGLGKHPDQLSTLHNRCLEILSGYLIKSGDLPLIHALHDLYQRLQQLASPTWMLRFAKNTAEYFEATLWEAQNRSYNRWPNTDNYMLMCPFSSGLYIVIDLIEIAEDMRIPCIVRLHPNLIKLINLTNNVVCWSNDIIALTRETSHGDMHNMVIVMQHELNISQQDALNLIMKLIDAQIQQFQALEKKLPKFADYPGQHVQRYVAVLRSWIRGNLDWAYESKHDSTKQDSTVCA